MSSDGRKMSLIIGGIIVVAVIVAIVLWNVGHPPAGGPATTSGQGQLTTKPPGPVTSEPVSADTKVPDANSQVAANVAKPTAVSSLVSGSDADNRSFDMQLNNDAFSPDTVIVRVNDLANVKIHAVDKSYTIVQPDYGFSLTIPKGQTKVLAGQLTAPGKYLLYCSSCGGPEKGPKGYLVAVPKQ